MSPKITRLFAGSNGLQVVATIMQLNKKTMLLYLLQSGFISTCNLSDSILVAGAQVLLGHIIGPNFGVLWNWNVIYKSSLFSLSYSVFLMLENYDYHVTPHLNNYQCKEHTRENTMVSDNKKWQIPAIFKDVQDDCCIEETIYITDPSEI